MLLDDPFKICLQKYRCLQYFTLSNFIGVPIQKVLNIKKEESESLTTWKYQIFALLHQIFNIFADIGKKSAPYSEGWYMYLAWIWVAGSRSGSRGAKMTHKIGKVKKISCFEVLDFSFEDWRLLLQLGRSLRSLEITKLHSLIRNI